MPGGKAVITITPTAGEPFQFDLSAADSVPLAGGSIVAVNWIVPIPSDPPYVVSGVSFHNEFDTYSQQSTTYTATAFVTFSDGTTDVAQASFTAPHSVV